MDLRGVVRLWRRPTRISSLWIFVGLSRLGAAKWTSEPTNVEYMKAGD
jgi:hypothetical protein